MKEEWRSVIRVVAALVFLGLGLGVLLRGMNMGFGLGTAVFLIFGFALWLIAALLLSPTVAGWFAAPWANLYFPGTTNEKPPPHYSLAEAKVQRDDFEGALADYVHITLNYPEEVRPYCEMIDIILQHLHDAERAAVVYRKGMDTLEKQEAQELLARHYRAALSRAAGRPEWGEVHTVEYKEDDAAGGGYRNAPQREHVPNPLRTSKPKDS